MPLVKNEQEVKRASQFLDYETGDGGNNVILKSHLYQIDNHFIDSVKRSVACHGDDCIYCGANYSKRAEYNYFAYINGQLGYMDIKGSVFFAMQGIAKAQKKDMRQMSWTVIKKGEGLATKYTTSKDDNLSEEDYKKAIAELDSNTDKLVQAMERHEEDLERNYAEYMSAIRDQASPKKKLNNQAKVDDIGDDTAEEGELTVNPSDIPF